MEGMEWNHFMTILLLVKNSLNLISFPPIPPNFGGMKI